MGPRFLTARVAGIAGIIFFIAVAVPGFASGGPPDPGDPAAKWLAYYSDHRSALAAGALFGVLGTLFGIFFFAKVISSMRRVDGNGAALSTAATIAISLSAALATVGGALSATAAFRLGTAEHVDAVTVEAISDASAILFTSIGAGLATLFVAEGLLMRASASVPAWLGLLWLVAAVPEFIGPFALLGTTGQFSPNGVVGLLLGLLPMGIVVVATSITMLVRPSAFDEDVAAGARATAVPAPAGAGAS